MRILLTGGDTILGAALARALATSHAVSTLGRADDGGARPTHVGDPRDRDTAAAATADADALIILVAKPSPALGDDDALDEATRGVYNIVTTARARRIVLVTSLRTFDRYPAEWRVTEQWAPRPTTAVEDLAPFLAEATVREVARVRPIQAICLRVGEVVDEDAIGGRAPRADWLHIDDAVRAIERALTFNVPAEGQQSGWWVFHIVGAGSRTRRPLAHASQAPFSFEPCRDVAAGADWPSPSPAPERARDRRPGGAARKVVIFGAGGPLGAITAAALAHDHVLRLSDRRPIAEIAAAAKPQSPGAPLPRVLEPPHEMVTTDVTDPGQVRDAARGMDAIVNCTVVRPHPVEAFRVNTLGAYNVMRAALEHGIRRVVHTGPQLVTLQYPAGYWYDVDVPSDAPPRPGDHIYSLSKYLGQEICRVFAEEHDLEVPTLVFSSFVDPAQPGQLPMGPFAMSVSWQDAAEAMRLALRAPSFPRPFENFFILGDLPHGKFSNEKAKRLLSWQPRDRLEHQWLRRE